MCLKLVDDPRATTDRNPQHHVGAAVGGVVHLQRAVKLCRDQSPHDLQAEAVGLLDAEAVG